LFITFFLYDLRHHIAYKSMLIDTQCTKMQFMTVTAYGEDSLNTIKIKLVLTLMTLLHVEMLTVIPRTTTKKILKNSK
jgi:hypothetical protein